MSLDADWKTAKNKLNGQTKKLSNHMRADLPRYGRGFSKDLALFEKIVAENQKNMNFFFNDLSLLQGSGDDLAKIDRFLPMLIKKYKAWSDSQKLVLKVLDKVDKTVRVYLKETQDASKLHDDDKNFKTALKNVKADLKKIDTDISAMLPKKITRS